MTEVTTEAVVLDKEDLGEYDSRVFLYTKDFGRVSAKATSLRKIASKIAGHLEPLNYVAARLVARGDYFNSQGFQLADALLINKKKSEEDLGILKEMLRTVNFLRLAIPDRGFDQELWNFLLDLNKGSGKSVKIQDLLKTLGFDSEFATCEVCKNQKPEYFYPKNYFFICNNCLPAASGLPSRDLILIYPHT